MSEKATHSAEYKQTVEALSRMTDDEVNKAYAEAQKRRAEAAYTTGHCQHNKQPGGCQLHNLQCGWPGCDPRPA